jgi:glycosyltransferase involved in cell wall biosynthesis
VSATAVSLAPATDAVVEVAHLTTTHDAFDTRIFWKECRTLARAGYGVAIIAPHEGDVTREGVRVLGVPLPRSRSERATLTAWRVFRTAERANARVVHLHDPELLAYAPLFQLLGRRVIYDAHENLPKDVMSKHYLPRPVRAMLAGVVDVAERGIASTLDGVVTVTPGIARRFPAERTVVVRNLPLLDEFTAATPADYAGRARVVLYLGGLNEIRGVRQMVRAIGRLDPALGAELWLAGRFDPPALEAELAREPGWARVRCHGWCSREKVGEMLAAARIGVLVLHPVPNHLDSLPIKLFEYMAAGLPVVASRFPAWEPILGGAGAWVDPLDDTALAAEIERLLADPLAAARMGAIGRAAVERELHWEREAAGLLALYERVAGSPRVPRPGP